jgi:hypothetical protein
MIVVTGLGRSGTSLVARLYKDLGFDPGGEWLPEVRAGFEDWDIVRANAAIVSDLRMSMTEDKWTHERLRREMSPEARREQAGLAFKTREIVESLAMRLLGRSSTQVALLPWDRFDAVLAQHAPRLRELAASKVVVKDPRFTWTLPLWAAAGAQIDHVLLCTRNVDAIVDSRNKANQIVFHTPEAAKNAFIYGFGLCVTTLIDHRIPYDVVRFPDFTSTPDDLYRAMRFPGPVSPERFREIFDRALDRASIHDER